MATATTEMWHLCCPAQLADGRVDLERVATVVIDHSPASLGEGEPQEMPSPRNLEEGGARLLHWQVGNLTQTMPETCEAPFCPTLLPRACPTSHSPLLPPLLPEHRVPLAPRVPVQPLLLCRVGRHLPPRAPDPPCLQRAAAAVLAPRRDGRSASRSPGGAGLGPRGEVHEVRG